MIEHVPSMHKAPDSIPSTSTWETLFIRLPRWLVLNNLPANAGDVRDVDSIPGSGKSQSRSRKTSMKAVKVH